MNSHENVCDHYSSPDHIDEIGNDTYDDDDGDDNNYDTDGDDIDADYTYVGEGGKLFLSYT